MKKDIKFDNQQFFEALDKLPKIILYRIGEFTCLYEKFPYIKQVKPIVKADFKFRFGFDYSKLSRENKGNFNRTFESTYLKESAEHYNRYGLKPCQKF